MRLAISNIAWDPSEDEQVFELLKFSAINAIDIAPGKYFPEPGKATTQDIIRIKEWWSERGVEIIGMQALLFGTTGLNLFGPTSVQNSMLDHLTAVCRIGSHLGAKKLVFGSPKNRDRSKLDDKRTLDIAAKFFLRLGDIAESHGVQICIEPAPTYYGSNFLTTAQETARFVKQISHQAIRMQFDTGAITISQEDPHLLLQEHSQLVGHIHASEPDLVPLGDGNCDHALTSDAIRRYLPEHAITIEMVATKHEQHISSIQRALATATAYTSTKPIDRKS